MQLSPVINNSYISQVSNTVSSLIETPIITYDTFKINILSKEISDRIKESKELQEFIKESINIISKDNNKLWGASIDTYLNDDEDNNKYIRFNFYTQFAFKDKSNLQSFDSNYYTTSLYNKILDLLLDKSDELINTVILDESFL